jgi:hypothetical protein
VTENYGSIVHYTTWSPLDTEAIRLEEGLLNTIKFSFTDRAGTPVPFPPYRQRLRLADSFGAAY